MPLTSHIEVLKKLMPPPKSPYCNDGDWHAVEERIGFQFPGDYKSFIRWYGSGSVMTFMHV